MCEGECVKGEEEGGVCEGECVKGEEIRWCV